ncbi:hypothetical protein PIB30_075617, partial [Stylosanthes scabra]|nr:hypothetical protein [Stylosanthes scabra]
MITMSKPLYFLLCAFFSPIFMTCYADTSSICAPSACGNGISIRYPFWIRSSTVAGEFCGYPDFGLQCSKDGYPVLQLETNTYYVTDINYVNHSITLVDIDVMNVSCPRVKNNVSIGSIPLSFSNLDRNITFYFNCTSQPSVAGAVPIKCLINGQGRKSYVFEVGKDNIGFVLDWSRAVDCAECELSDGYCAYNGTTRQTICMCKDGRIVGKSCKKGNRQRWIVFGIVAASVVGVLALAMAFLFYQRQKKTSYGMSSDPSSLEDTEKISQYNGVQRHRYPPTAWHYASSGAAGLLATCFTCKSLRIKGNRDIETFLENHGVLTLKRYKFSDVKKMTNSFKVKLGQGGFGTVYKGKLPNGSAVAVKMLTQSKGNGEEFINEVASISRTSHVNVVTLLGFCLEGHQKVLIYEFMSNGSLDNFIFKKEPKNTPLLSWEKLYQISTGIARGLEYLHRGCNIRILHFDIKPHNILLDESFCPKISDFGLAKLCPRKESHVSMSETRGTIGYIAPEVFNRHFGRVSHKSDVYSFGMMLIEMVGMKENNKIAETGQTSEKYFP